MQWDQRIFIAELNVEHFRTRLAGQLDDAQRRTVTALLAEEKDTLLNLKAAAAEGELSALIDLLALRAGPLFGADASDAGDAPDIREQFASIFDRVPVGMGAVNSAGAMILSNAGMQHFVPHKIPSRDPERLRHFRTKDGPLSPLMWPGARALRGEPVNPGMAFVHTGPDGEDVEIRVAAVPVRDGARIAGALAAVYELKIIGGGAVWHCLAHLVAEETGRHNGSPAAQIVP